LAFSTIFGTSGGAVVVRSRWPDGAAAAEDELDDGAREVPPLEVEARPLEDCGEGEDGGVGDDSPRPSLAACRAMACAAGVVAAGLGCWPLAILIRSVAGVSVEGDRGVRRGDVPPLGIGRLGREDVSSGVPRNGRDPLTPWVVVLPPRPMARRRARALASARTRADSPRKSMGIIRTSCWS